MRKLFSTGQVRHMLGIPQHRIGYAISSRYLPDAKFRFLDKRCFDLGDVRRIAQHFGIPMPEGGGDVQV
jgi:hypothetical protein